MIKIIKLKGCRGANDILYLNAFWIKYIEESEKGNGDVKITMLDKSYWFVKNSIEDILLKINTDTTLPPVLMSAEEFELMNRRAM